MKSNIVIYSCFILTVFFCSSKLAASNIHPSPFASGDDVKEYVDNTQNDNSYAAMSKDSEESLFNGFLGEKRSEYWQCAPKNSQPDVFWTPNVRKSRRSKIADIPIYSNKKVESFINFYNRKRRDIFLKAIERSAGYMKMIRRILREYKLPLELGYLPVVESNFNPNARSRAGALGLWQFMAGTGKMFGLQRSWWHDDRYDPEKSTVAAAKYLKRLIQKFDGQWELALAAYNAGARKVQNALKKARKRNKPTDFWSLKLPRETRGYVPAFLATVIMFKDLEAYGFKQSSTWREEEPKQFIKVAGGISLEKIGQSLGVSPQTIKRMNPALRKGNIVPLGYRRYKLAIPALIKTAEKREKIASLQKHRYKGWKFYKVSKGDTLWSIAKRYQIHANEIAVFNPSINNAKKIIKTGQTIILPFPAGRSSASQKSASYDKSKIHNYRIKAGNKTKAKTAVVHRIKGDSLRKTSRKYNISTQQIRNLKPVLNRKILKAGGNIDLKPRQKNRSLLYY